MMLAACRFLFTIDTTHENTKVHYDLAQTAPCLLTL